MMMSCLLSQVSFINAATPHTRTTALALLNPMANAVRACVMRCCARVAMP
jgi:hypothetical protein